MFFISFCYCFVVRFYALSINSHKHTYYETESVFERVFFSEKSGFQVIQSIIYQGSLHLWLWAVFNPFLFEWISYACYWYFNF